MDNPVLNIEALFAWTQPASAVVFNQNPVVQMVVSKLQALQQFGYRFDSSTNSSRVEDGRARVFPDFSFKEEYKIPFSDKSVQSAVENAAPALTMKCIFSKFNSIESNWDQSKFNTPISTLNALLDDKTKRTSLYIDYIRQVFHLSPSPEAAATYRAKLKSIAWQAMRDTEMQNGTWPNPPLQMYLHFVKFSACGATQDDVKTLYNDITTGNLSLHKEAFFSITPETWSTWDGWVTWEHLDSPHMNYQGLDKVVVISTQTKNQYEDEGGGSFMYDDKVPLYKAWYDDHK